MANNSVYQLVTDRIIAELEKGQIPWHKPWVTGIATGNLKDLAYNRVTGRPYSLLNQMLLGRPGEWMSFKQCKAAGGSVLKGEKGRPVVFWKQILIDEEDVDKNGEPVTKKKKVPMLRYYTVFHVSQTTLEPKKRPELTETPALTWEPEEEAERVLQDYFSREGVKFSNQAGDRAYYMPGFDSITVPLKEQFKDMAEYYSTLYHETVHSTGHKSRLDRFGKDSGHFGSGEYSREELVAELGSAISLNRLGIETDYSFRNSTAYIQSWLQNLREDCKAIVFASSRAEKAVKLIFNDDAEEAKESTAA